MKNSLRVNIRTIKVALGMEARKCQVRETGPDTCRPSESMNILIYRKDIQIKVVRLSI